MCVIGFVGIVIVGEVDDVFFGYCIVVVGVVYVGWVYVFGDGGEMGVWGQGVGGVFGSWSWSGGGGGGWCGSCWGGSGFFFFSGGCWGSCYGIFFDDGYDLVGGYGSVDVEFDFFQYVIDW